MKHRHVLSFSAFLFFAHAHSAEPSIADYEYRNDPIADILRNYFVESGSTSGDMAKASTLKAPIEFAIDAKTLTARLAEFSQVVNTVDPLCVHRNFEGDWQVTFLFGRYLPSGGQRSFLLKATIDAEHAKDLLSFLQTGMPLRPPSGYPTEHFDETNPQAIAVVPEFLRKLVAASPESVTVESFVGGKAGDDTMVIFVRDAKTEFLKFVMIRLATKLERHLRSLNNYATVQALIENLKDLSALIKSPDLKEKPTSFSVSDVDDLIERLASFASDPDARYDLEQVKACAADIEKIEAILEASSAKLKPNG